MKPSIVVTDLAQLLQRYFCSYLINQRRLSHHTMTSYRDMFKLLLPYIAKQLNKSVCALSLSDINVDVIILFLAYLEETRGNKVKTRNARLAAIHSFLAYAVVEEPQALPDIQRVMAIPEKRTDHFLFVCLEKDEIEALLNVHDLTTWTGQRDYILLVTLYNTGARVSEITRIQLKDVDIQRQKIIHLHGKGRKERIIPLWDNTCLEIKKWLNNYKSSPESPLIPNRYGNQMTRFGVRQRLI